MAFGLKVTTSNPAAVISTLEAQGINCTVWNLGTHLSRGPVEVELGFESAEDLEAAKAILAPEPALA